MTNTELYHSPQIPGFWTEMDVLLRTIRLNSGSEVADAAPVEIARQGDTLVMVLSTPEGKVYEPIDNFPGMRVVKGNAKEHPYETDGEPLIEIHYYKVDRMEPKPRRIRPTNIMFGIHGDTNEPDPVMGGSHRGMGESRDYYLEGEDTQYGPPNDPTRRFPFWRIGVWGNPGVMATVYLPGPQPQEER